MINIEFTEKKREFQQTYIKPQILKEFHVWVSDEEVNKNPQAGLHI